MFSFLFSPQNARSVFWFSALKRATILFVLIPYQGLLQCSTRKQGDRNTEKVPPAALFRSTTLLSGLKRTETNQGKRGCVFNFTTHVPSNKMEGYTTIAHAFGNYKQVRFTQPACCRVQAFSEAISSYFYLHTLKTYKKTSSSAIKLANIRW